MWEEPKMTDWRDDPPPIGETVWLRSKSGDPFLGYVERRTISVDGVQMRIQTAQGEVADNFDIRHWAPARLAG